jgi:hypothetical protein
MAEPAPWKMPPLIKIYEAIGAVADGRVHLEDENHASVISSETSKSYLVESSGREISANYNASYWQGYLGYPAIAVMIARGILRPPPDTLVALRGFPWKELNRRFRNDYELTLREVANRIIEGGGDPAAVDAACAELLEALRSFAPRRGRRRRPPRSR